MFKIDRAVCFCVDKRYAEAKKLQEQGKQHGLDIELYIGGKGQILDKSLYNYIDIEEVPPWWEYGDKNMYNLNEMVLEVVKKAKRDGVEILALFEDDNYILPRFTDAMRQLEKQFVKTEWDIIRLGYALYYVSHHLFYTNILEFLIVDVKHNIKHNPI